jgi:hypothetical protein
MTVLRPITRDLLNYMPSGPTPLVYAVLAQYHAMVPHMYKYRVATSASPPSTDPFTGMTFSDKTYKYAIAVHLALLQWPGSLLGALVGWVVGYAWRQDLLPASLVAWRLPGWMVGLDVHRRSREFEGLRRRLEGENGGAAGGQQGTATATGASSQGQRDGQQAERRRRTMGQQIMDQFREAL